MVSQNKDVIYILDSFCYHRFLYVYDMVCFWVKRNTNQPCLIINKNFFESILYPYIFFFFVLYDLDFAILSRISLILLSKCFEYPSSAILHTHFKVIISYFLFLSDFILCRGTIFSSTFSVFRLNLCKKPFLSIILNLFIYNIFLLFSPNSNHHNHAIY